MKEKIVFKRRNRLKKHFVNTSNVLLYGYQNVSDAAKITFQVIDGFDWENKEGIWGKVEEEFEELNKTIHDQDSARVGEEIGDLIFSLVNLARHWGLNAEHLLRNTNQKFIKRFQYMEEELKSAGIQLHKATSDELKHAWEKIKIKTG